ncbi:hypothetical protein ABMY29_09650, partial [Vibrio vulnificus]
PPLASDALAIRIVFPLVRVTPFSFKWTGLPALLGKQLREPFGSLVGEQYQTLTHDLPHKRDKAL